MTRPNRPWGPILKLAAIAGASPAARAAAPAPGITPEQGFSVWGLFWESADLFTLLIVLGSVAALTIAVRCVLEIRPAVVSPRRATAHLEGLVAKGNLAELRSFVQRDGSMVSTIVRAAADQAPRGHGAMRESAEIAASVECAKWFRKIEPLNVIGNLGPLVGLAGTVWGMVLAFTTLGVEGGQAGPASLSLGISKALFHTLLGLMLAIPCLLMFGIYRGVVDRICNRAMADAARLVERLPTGEPEASGESRKRA